MSTKHSGLLGRTSNSEDVETKAPLTESFMNHGANNSGYTNTHSTPHSSLLSLKASVVKRREADVFDIVCPKENVAPNRTGENFSNQMRHVEEVVKPRRSSTSNEIQAEFSCFLTPDETSINHGGLFDPNSSRDIVTNTVQTAVSSSLFSLNDEEDEELTAIFEYTRLHRPCACEIQDHDQRHATESSMCGRRNPAVPHEDIVLTVLEDTHDFSLSRSAICYAGSKKASVQILNPEDLCDIEAEEFWKDSRIEVIRRSANDTSSKLAAESAFPYLVNFR